MSTKPNLLPETASQTAGPYVHIGLAPRTAGFSGFTNDLGSAIAGPSVSGQRIRIEGVIYDGNGAPVCDAMLEAWQADANGRYANTEDQVDVGFDGWGRACADFETGLWTFDTIKPGPVSIPSGELQAPHINLWIVARGINIGLSTRLYFEDEDTNASDPLLMCIEDAKHRQTLIAKKISSEGDVTYRFDIHLQGEQETVFLDM